MKYTPATLIKAVLAAVVALVGTASAAANGPDLSHIDFDQWLTAIGTAIVAGAALLHSPKKGEGATPNDKAAATVTDVVTKAAEAHGQLVQQALDGIQKVQDATGELTKLLPGPVGSVAGTVFNDVELAATRLGLGPLATGVINSLPRY